MSKGYMYSSAKIGYSLVKVIFPNRVSCLFQAYYYSAIVEDVLLRFSWTLTVTLSTFTTINDIKDILTTILAPLEVFR